MLQKLRSGRDDLEVALNGSNRSGDGVGGIGCVGRADRRERSGTLGEDSDAVHEVGVLLDVVLSVQPRHDIFEEGTGITAGYTKLSDPQSAVTSGNVGLLDVLNEVGEVLSSVVPMDGDEVDIALSVACSEEVSKPCEALSSSSIGDSWCTDLGRTTKRVHVLNVASGSGSWCEVGLSRIVRLVETED